MARQNLFRSLRHLTPSHANRATQLDALRRARLADAICDALDADPGLAPGSDAARHAGIRRVFVRHVEAQKKHWVGGAPTEADLAVVERRIADLFGLSAEDVTEALKEHPRPATVG